VQRVVAAFRARADVFDGRRAQHFVASFDPGDRERIAESADGFHVLWDFERKVARRLGVLDVSRDPPRLLATSFVIDANLRVLAVVPIDDVATHVDRVVAAMEPARAPEPAPTGLAPVLLLPRVLEPELCRELVDAFEQSDARETGALLTLPGQAPIVVVDHEVKRRRDTILPDGPLLRAVHARISKRLVPEVRKVFQFHAAHIERYALACYEATSGGFFRAHRDNQGKAVAHRKFACSLNLDAEGYDGGDVSFPEYGSLRYRAPTGGALVFSCAVLHQVDPVVRGRRHCLLPFLYDEAGEAVRKANRGKAAP
jgi:predicted 2-oxoglutarate/Fe(II)-dependent dioxygenase YbiX